MVIKKITDFIDKEHIKILITITVLLIALVAFIEYSTINGEALKLAILQFIEGIFHKL